MAGFVRWIKRFIGELRRRRVIRVAVVYAGTAFVILQLGEILVQPFNLPGWTLRLVTFLLILGFPLAVGLAWVYNLTEEGVVREVGEGTAGEKTFPQGSPFTSNGLIVGLLFLVAGLLLYPRVFSSGVSTSEQASPASTSPDTTRAARGPSPPAERAPRVAVLPFESIARDTTDGFFAQGMHEEVLNQLSKVSGLEVISRTSMMRYADTDKPVPTISKELGGISALVEGTVRRAGGRVRITTQLIKAPEDKHLWSKTYERTLSVEQIFDIQADIAGQIAAALETELTEGERKRIESAPTEDLAAYEAYLKGRNEASRFYGTLKLTQIDRAIAHFREAVRQDPSFAQAHARLADTYRMRYTWHSSDERWIDSTEAALKRARAINRKVPQIHWVQGFVHINQDSLEAAATSFRRALDLQPSNAIACSGLSTVLSLQGRLAESVQWAHRAYRLEPDWTFRHREMGTRLKEIGMLDAAAAWFRLVHDTDPENALGAWKLTDLYLSQGKIQRAAETVESYRSRRPDHPLGDRLAAEVALHRGRPEEARRLLEKMPKVKQRADAFSVGAERMLLGLAKVRSGEREAGREMLQEAADSIRVRLDERKGLLGWDHLRLARGLAVLGQKGEALAHLRGAMERGNVDYHATRTDPFFESLRPDPRFQKILRQMKSMQEQFRKKVRAMDINLYPPGAESNPKRTQPETGA